MRISFSPQRHDDTLTLSKSGDILTINGMAYDFSPLPDGATIPAGEIPCEWVTGPVERIGGEIHLTLILPHGPNPPPEVSFPEPITVTEDGPITLPGNAQDVDA